MIRFAPPRRMLRFAASERGSTTAEFALVIPAMLLITLGTINAGVMAFTAGQLHYATQAAARCGAVDATNCGTTGATVTYPRTKYTGPDIAPSFTASVSATCSTVTGTGTFQFVTGVASLSVPLSAKACYPLQPTS